MGMCYYRDMDNTVLLPLAVIAVLALMALERKMNGNERKLTEAYCTDITNRSMPGIIKATAFYGVVVAIILFVAMH